MTGLVLWAIDLLFLVVHLTLVFFNLTGWLWPAARVVHRWCVGLTLLCWLGAGALVGRIGYCPLTDWHWFIKRARGEQDLPSSFIDYALQMINIHLHPQTVDQITGIAFGAIVCITIFIWAREILTGKNPRMAEQDAKARAKMRPQEAKPIAKPVNPPPGKREK